MKTVRFIKTLATVAAGTVFATIPMPSRATNRFFLYDDSQSKLGLTIPQSLIATADEVIE